jgi:hypothetical protein
MANEVGGAEIPSFLDFLAISHTVYATVMQPKIKALVIAEDERELEDLVEVLESAGLAPDKMLGMDFLPASKLRHDLVVVELRRDTERLNRLMEKVKRKAQVVATVPSETGLAEQLRLLALPNCNHIIKEGPQRSANLLVTAQKLTSGDIFGVEHYLPASVEVKYLRLKDYRGRSSAIDRIVDYAREAKFRRAQRQHIAQVCEELLMNALYNAPVDENGHFVFAEVDPKERLDMPTPRPVSIRYAASDRWFAVAVRDRFGTLKKKRIVQYLNKCLQGEQQIDSKTSGAGLGLYLVASRASVYVNNIAPGIATEAIAIFDRRQGRERSLENLGVFIHPGKREEVSGGGGDES